MSREATATKPAKQSKRGRLQRSQLPHDPTKPYCGRQSRWETFCLALAEGKNQHEAYLVANPRASLWTRAAVDTAASDLAAKVQPRVSYLRERATNAKIMSITRRKEVLSRIAENVGEADITDYLEAGADGVYVSVGKESPRRGAIAYVKSRTEIAAEGSGKNDAVITDMGLHSPKVAIDAIDLLNKMDGAYPKDGGGGLADVIGNGIEFVIVGRTRGKGDRE